MSLKYAMAIDSVFLDCIQRYMAVTLYDTAFLSGLGV